MYSLSQSYCMISYFFMFQIDGLVFNHANSTKKTIIHSRTEAQKVKYCSQSLRIFAEQGELYSSPQSQD